MSATLVKIMLMKYPKIRDYVIGLHDDYNSGIEKLIELEKQGRILIVYPRECFGISTIKRDKEGFEKLYQLGYEDGKKIEDFINSNR